MIVINNIQMYSQLSLLHNMRYISTKNDAMKVLDRMLRVNQAGELAANMIYKGQLVVLGNTPSGSIINTMWEQEKNHLDRFNIMIAQYHVRPSALTPLWMVMSYGLGITTALLGKEAAMACTEAVETVVGEHYNKQLLELDKLNMTSSFPEVVSLIEKSRDEELEHLHIAIDNDAHSSQFYNILSNIIQVGCKTAIEIAKHV